MELQWYQDLSRLDMTIEVEDLGVFFILGIKRIFILSILPPQPILIIRGLSLDVLIEYARNATFKGALPIWGGRQRSSSGIGAGHVSGCNTRSGQRSMPEDGRRRWDRARRRWRDDFDWSAT